MFKIILKITDIINLINHYSSHVDSWNIQQHPNENNSKHSSFNLK